MLTVKHVGSDGRESVFEAGEVHKREDGRVFAASQRGATAYEIVGGTVYVMGDKGATVAKYDLEPKAAGYRYPPPPTTEELAAAVVSGEKPR